MVKSKALQTEEPPMFVHLNRWPSSVLLLKWSHYVQSGQHPTHSINSESRMRPAILFVRLQQHQVETETPKTTPKPGGSFLCEVSAYLNPPRLLGPPGIPKAIRVSSWREKNG